MSSVISASRRCEGRMSESFCGEYVESRAVADNGLLAGLDGFVSESTVGGEIGSLIVDCEGVIGCLEDLVALDVARDMSRTSTGRIRLPSVCV